MLIKRKRFAVKHILLVLLCLTPWFHRLCGIDMLVKSTKMEHDPISVCICLEPDEMIYKDSIRVSIASPLVQNIRWEIGTEAVEEYVAPLKTHKKVYADSCEMRVRYDCPEGSPIGKTGLTIACFVISEDETVLPFMKRIELQGREPEAEPVVQQVPTAIPLVPAKPTSNRLFILLLFLGLAIAFVTVNLLSIADVGLLFFLGAWFFLMRERLLFISAGLLFIAALWYMNGYEKSRSGLRLIRLVLAILCAASVLPVIVQAYLVG